MPEFAGHWSDVDVGQDTHRVLMTDIKVVTSSEGCVRAHRFLFTSSALIQFKTWFRPFRRVNRLNFGISWKSSLIAFLISSKNLFETFNEPKMYSKVKSEGGFGSEIK